MSYLFFSSWLFALVAVPVLIHLINLLRHRRVKWAAMEFLLKSQKRRKKWIVFKQLLLLAARMGAVALAVLMAFRPEVRDEWGKLFGGARTHHIVLLDDSYSMSDRRGDSTAFDRGKLAVERLVAHAAEQGGRPRFTLLRFSGATHPELQPAESIEAEFSGRLKSALDGMQPSQTAATCADALEALRQLPTATEDENRIVYVISDFRRREWNEPNELRPTLADLGQRGAKLHLIHCVDAARDNLAITSLEPQVGTRAAGVELFMDVAVTNFGDEPAYNVAIRLEEDGNARPGLTFDAVLPGETVLRQFPVNFVAPGEHSVTARLESDAVETDNARFAVVDVPEKVPVLVVDGGQVDSDLKIRETPLPADSFFLINALDPRGKVRTGLAPVFAKPQVLRREEELKQYHTLYLLNVGQLDAAEIEAVENFARRGGGVAIVLGEEASKEFYNSRLYREGNGLFPVPLDVSTNLLASRVAKTPDLKVTNHPVFRPFLKLRNNPLDAVRVERYFQVPATWTPPADGSVRVVARLRNGAPLVVERPFGEGRVVALLTKLSPVETRLLGRWNNWGRNYSFPPTMLSLQGYLAQPRQRTEQHLVGKPLTLELDPNRYAPQVRFEVPRGDTSEQLQVDAATSTRGLVAELDDTGSAGIYEAGLTTLDGAEQVRRFAYNVIPGEGDLKLLGGEQLAARLEGIDYRFHRADDLSYASEALAGYPLANYLLYGLIALLVAEQALAYSASYHPPRKEVAA